MTYTVKFAERGHVWQIYKGVIRYYRANGRPEDITSIKIHGPRITVRDEAMLNDLEAFIKKLDSSKIKYKIEK
ncbi:hypothetical protein K8R33_04720 [archaeon]|nr:hypothetical protein [archaeon]